MESDALISVPVVIQMVKDNNSKDIGVISIIGQMENLNKEKMSLFPMNGI